MTSNVEVPHSPSPPDLPPPSLAVVKDRVPADLDRKPAEVLYAQAARVAEVFWEWRHKVITHFVATIGGSVVASGWFLKEEHLRRWTFVPLLFGAGFSVVCHLLDRRNDRILRACYDVARDLERDAFGQAGIFAKIRGLREDSLGWSYFAILRVTYLSTALFLLVSALTLAILMQ